ncbi:hypothetical protein FLA_1308 [Filimonas lacunae]|nr:hypothetical protein FLA_1308 [Filimonas lacunae]
MLTMICLLGSGCISTQKAGSGLSEGFGSKASLISKNLVLGLDSGLAASTLRAQLCATIDSVITVAGISTNKNISRLLDSVLSKNWSALVQQLVEDVSGKQLRQNLENIREALIGAKTREDVQAILNTLLSDTNTNKIIRLKNELLGETTARQMGMLTDTLMAHIIPRLNNEITDSTLHKLSRFLNQDVQRSIDTNLSVVQKYADWFLAGLALVAAFIITLVWQNRQKYLKLTTLLAAQVNAIPDQKTYDLLTARIKASAANAGVEPTLRTVLQENNLLNTNSWKPLE